MTDPCTNNVTPYFMYLVQKWITGLMENCQVLLMMTSELLNILQIEWSS